VAKARDLIAQYDGLVPSVLADGGLNGQIKLGAIGTTLTGLTPRAMAALKERVPGIGLHIRPGLTGAMLAELERGTLDAALVTKPGLTPSGLTFRPLAQEPMHLITALEEPDDDPLTLLRTRPYIRFNRTAVLGCLIDTWLLSKRIRVTEAMELDSAESIESMVQANLGVSIVPELAVPPPQTILVKRVALGAEAPVRVVGLAYRQDTIRPRAIDAVFDAFDGVIAKAKTA
ncbi:MAG: LysR substrate-binding domain-containing protein, partial [Pseudomonadota bacterium]